MLQVILYTVVIKFGRLHAVHGREMRGAMGKAVEKGEKEICDTMVWYHFRQRVDKRNETRRPTHVTYHTLVRVTPRSTVFWYTPFHFAIIHLSPRQQTPRHFLPL